MCHKHDADAAAAASHQDGEEEKELLRFWKCQENIRLNSKFEIDLGLKTYSERERERKKVVEEGYRVEIERREMKRGKKDRS